MAIRITGRHMTSDQVPVAAEYRPHAAAEGPGAWAVSWLPERLFNRNQAITAIALAEEVAAALGDGLAPEEFYRDSRRWAFIRAHAAEIGMTASDAARRLAAIMRRADAHD